MTAGTLTLTEFLLARIAEDEARARDLADEWLGENWPAQTLEDDWEFVREMIEAWLEPARPGTPPAFRRFDRVFNERDMRQMAAKYADHPDYRKEWAL